MPDRIVRASILTSESMAKLSWGAEVFYRRLFSVADDYGRFDGRPAVLRAALYPLQLETATESKIAAWLTETVTHGVTRCYAVKGVNYLEINKFDQRIQGRPKFPSPDESDDTTVGNGGKPCVTAYAHASSPSPKSSLKLPFDSADFKAAWQDWEQHRREIKKPVTPTSGAAQLARLEAMGERAAIDTIRHTIAKGWQGLRTTDGEEPSPAVEKSPSAPRVDRAKFKAWLAATFPRSTVAHPNELDPETRGIWERFDRGEAAA